MEEASTINTSIRLAIHVVRVVRSYADGIDPHIFRATAVLAVRIEHVAGAGHHIVVQLAATYPKAIMRGGNRRAGLWVSAAIIERNFRFCKVQCNRHAGADTVAPAAYPKVQRRNCVSCAHDHSRAAVNSNSFTNLNLQAINRSAIRAN